jgi:hypothetical protein
LKDIEKMLLKVIKSMPDIIEESNNEFSKNNRRISLIVKKNEVIIKPIDYYYISKGQVIKEEYELKGAIETYFKYGDINPRLRFEERSENNRAILYCIVEAKGIKIEFRPTWHELLNGVNQMVHTEHKNEGKQKKNLMNEIAESLRKITTKAGFYASK